MALPCVNWKKKKTKKKTKLRRKKKRVRLLLFAGGWSSHRGAITHSLVQVGYSELRELRLDSCLHRDADQSDAAAAAQTRSSTGSLLPSPWLYIDVITILTFVVFYATTVPDELCRTHCRIHCPVYSASSCICTLFSQSCWRKEKPYQFKRKGFCSPRLTNVVWIHLQGRNQTITGM